MKERKVDVQVAETFQGSWPQFRNKDTTEAITTFNTNKRVIPPIPLPTWMRDHALKGDLKGYRECHLAHDILLIYTHKDDVVKMLLVCTHKDLAWRAKAILKPKPKPKHKQAAKKKN